MTSSSTAAQPRSPEIGKSVLAGPVNTNYLEAGAGAPVVLIHGSGPGVSAYANWRLTIPVLAEKLHVFAYDQVGFGYSDLPSDEPYTLARWTKHLLDFMDAAGLERAHLVGNSMGAAVAIAAAVEHPARVDRLVLMGPCGVRFPIVEGTGLDFAWGYTPSVENMRRLIDLFVSDKALATDELAQLRYKAALRPGVQEAFSSMFPAPRQNGVDGLAAFEDRLDAIRARTLIFHGRDDRIIPLSTSLKLLQKIPDAQLHVFGACGHWTQIEHAAEFSRLTRDFLTID
ncbi:MAG: alpha/beta fold hydrolase [Candidatus Velthaea sp.]|jgi:pimeloyl-ACP methyl ester carboxylesterase